MSPSLPALLVVILATAASCGHGEPVAVRPGGVPVIVGDFHSVDDAKHDDDFAAFTKALRVAADRRDSLALLALVSETARFSFDDVPLGAAGLRTVWLDDHADALWPVLGRLAVGGWVAEEDTYTAPYVFKLWPSDLDPFAHVAVPGPGAPAYDQPGGEPVARLSGMIVPILGPRNGDYWQVSLPDGSAAHVRAQDAVSPLGHRVTCWPDADGEWRIQTMLSGD